MSKQILGATDEEASADLFLLSRVGTWTSALGREMESWRWKDMRAGLD